MSNKANRWLADLGKDWHAHIPIHAVKKGGVHANETRKS